MSTMELTVSYDDVEASLAPIGGTPALLAGLPAFLPDISEAMLATIEQGIREKLPVDMKIDLPGLTYIVHLRAADDVVMAPDSSD